MKIKTIALDFGGIVVALNFEKAVSHFERLGVKDVRSFLNPFQQGGFFGDLESGRIDEEAFRFELSRQAGREISRKESSDACMAFIENVPEHNLETILKLRESGLRLLLLSNTNPYVMKWAMSPAFDGKGHSLHHYFDKCYLSYMMKTMKPDERYFRTVLDNEKTAPGEILFVDDGISNIEAAQKFGIRTMLAENNADWTKDILTIALK